MESFLGFCDDEGHSTLDANGGRRLREYIAEHFKGQEYVLTVQSPTSLRSKKANAYYWSIVVKAAAEETHQDEDSIHAFWCEKFLPNEHKRVAFYSALTGETIEMEVDDRRTSKLTGRPFYDYVEECRLWLQEFLGVTTPDPDKEYWRKRELVAVAPPRTAQEREL